MALREASKEHTFIKAVYFFFPAKAENSPLCNYYSCFTDEEMKAEAADWQSWNVAPV